MGQQPSSTEIWWQLLCRKIEVAKAQIPASLSGVVSIEVLQHDGATVAFHLDVDGPATVGVRGSVDRSQARVVTSEAELSEVLFAKHAPKNAIHVHGDARLFIELLESLKRERSHSLLSIRGACHENDHHRPP